MGFDFNGYVLRAPRTAPANALTTADATGGVVRDIRDLPASYDTAGTLVEASADQFRASTLENSDPTASQEYLVWAANTSTLTTIEDTDWAITAEDPEASVRIPSGNVEVVDTSTPPNARFDGSTRLVVQDVGGRSIADIRLISIRRGDSSPLDPPIEMGPDASGGPLFDFASQDPDAGVANLSAPSLAALGGGVSNRRGDTIVEVQYVIAGARFWWTRNDKNVTRFGFNSKTQRWEPRKGSPTASVGVLAEGETYTLVPRPTRFDVGDFLPGTTGSPDAYAMVRLGIRPDSTSTVISVLVVTDEDAEDTDRTFGAEDAVVGVNSGTLQFNPTFVTTAAGQRIWYSFESFQGASTGEIGPMLNADDDPLFITPIPGPTDYPFISFGSRRYLLAFAVETEADLPPVSGVGSPSEGEVYWAQSTGKLVFSPADLTKADTGTMTAVNPSFDLQFLDEKVFYDGVSMTKRSIGTREPVALVDDTGTPTPVDAGNALYIPAAVSMPTPGVSGVLHVADGTGTIPTFGIPGTRPGTSGLVRQIEGVGDTIIFGRAAAIEEIKIVEFESDLPDLPFAIRRGTAWVARERNSGGDLSRVSLGLRDRARFGGELVYFLQADVMPAVFATETKMYSRELEPFVFDGTETLYFNIDGSDYTVSPPAATYTATVLASVVDAVITGTGSATALNGRIVLEGDSSIEIAFGPSASVRDLSGAAILGLLPGWRIDSSASENWLADNGSSVGLFRSPTNRDRSSETPDFNARGIFSETLLTGSVIANPYFTVDNPPLQDVAGYDVDIFFQLVEGLSLTLLENYKDVRYEFAGNRRFAWIEQASVTGQVTAPSTSLPLGNPSVLGATLHPAVEPGNGLYLASTGGAFTPLTLGDDYVLPGGGNLGQALLANNIGGQAAVGSAGTVTGSGLTAVFSDPNATWITDGVLPGYLLQIEAGDLLGWYVISGVPSETTLEVLDAPLLAGPDEFIAYRIYEAYDLDTFDPGVVADIQYEEFNHLPDEPFKVRQLSSVGSLPANKTAQASARLAAVATESIQRGRDIRVRFGLESGNAEATATVLANTELGILSNSGLAVPDLSDPHYSTASATDPSFIIQVGSNPYTLGVNMTLVSAFSDPSTLTDEVEVGAVGSGIDGEIQFANDILEAYEGSQVYYFESYLDPDVLAAGEVEIEPSDGTLNFSTADMASEAGSTAYFTELMITERGLDVVISPLSGTVYFNRPLRDGQIVEVSYFQAKTDGSVVTDDDGNTTEITEFLPLLVVEEECTEANDRLYNFNPTGRTVVSPPEPVVWVGANRQNYGSIDTSAFDLDLGQVSFVESVESGTSVRINYAVLEAFGGEESYSASTLPVFRPPFFLDAETTVFTLASDRTSLMVPGKLLRIGETPIYIVGASYDAGADLTTVTIFPETLNEVGSRSPGNDLNSLLTSEPVTTEIAGTPTTANAGFLLPLSATYEPVDRGMLSIIFYGDVTTYAVPGHLLEMGGYPLLISAGTLSDDGLTTRVDVTTPFPKGFSPLFDTVKISVRPIYPPGPRDFLGMGAVVEGEPSALVLLGSTDDIGSPIPGRTLVPNVEYSINANTGAVTLLEQYPALKPGERLVFLHTRLGVLAPFVAGGVLNFPRFRANYSHIKIPDEEGLILGSVLQASYTFRSPDSFYFRAVPLRSYMGEVAQNVAAAAASQSATGGPITAAPGEPKNYEQGSLGLTSQRQDLVDQDRASRTFISLYNEALVSFEQLVESMGSNGGVIGDRDGKFRFFVGRDKVYPPPGWEDQITGVLNPRTVWFRVFTSASPTGIEPNGDDIIVDPETATQDPTSLEVEGDFMDPNLLRFYSDQQRPLIKNDIDDWVLVGIQRPKITLGFPPFPRLKALGDFRQMGENHRFSRIFPQATLVFTTTYPGLKADALTGDPGVYAFSKMLEPPSLFKGEGAVFGSTFRSPIGSLSNPALGTIVNTTDAEIRARRARARIWAYSPTGFPDIEPLTEDLPTVIATPLFLKDFPVNPDTGLPDPSKFISEGGTLADLLTGDAEFSTPPFKPLDRKENLLPQVAFGRPDGSTFAVGNAQKTIGTGLFGGLFDIDPSYGGIFVGAVYQGCLITFVDDDGNDIESGNDLLALGAGELEGSPVELFKGDTIYVTPPGALDTSDANDTPTVEEQQEANESLPIYRRGFDVGINKNSGEFRDLSLPSWKDPSPFGLKELLGQNGPSPLSTIEADVEFVNNQRTPHEFPALRGEIVNDSGDYGIPYLDIGGTTELERLGSVQSVVTSILTTDSPTPQSVYPQEIVGTDGTVISPSGLGGPPAATLLTGIDLEPTGGAYTPNSGVGDARRYDVLMVEVPSSGGLPASSQGILSIGEVDSTLGHIEPPRFPAATQLGDRFRYIFVNAMTHLDPTGASGAVVEEVAGTTTEIDISSVGGLIFDDGTATTSGGLNDIVDGTSFPFPNENRIFIQFFDPGTGLLVETITIAGATAAGTLGVAPIGSTVKFDDKKISIPAVGFVDFTALGTAAPGPTVPYNIAITVDTWVGGIASAGSDTGHILEDRLTFQESYDLSTVLPRGTTTVGAVPVDGGLFVRRVTCSGNDDCDVNDSTNINNLLPLTFLPRDATTGVVGTFGPSGGPPLTEGRVKAMAFEGYGNTALTTSAPVTFSAIPSSDEGEAGSILSGDGSALDGTEALLDVTAGTGALTNVEAGDVAYVTAAASGSGGVKQGTYLVRHSVPEAGSTQGANTSSPVATAPSSAGWVQIEFPVVVSSNVGGGAPREITISSVDGPGPGGFAWAPSGRLYVIPNISDPTTVISVAYTSFTPAGVFTITGGSGLTADGTLVTNNDFDTAALAGLRVSGFAYLPVGGFAAPLPDNNTVSFGNGETTAGGLRELTLSNPSFYSPQDVTSGARAQTFSYSSGSTLANGADTVDVVVAAKTPSTTFLPDPTEIIYDNVADYMDISSITATVWDNVHTDGTGDTSDVACVLPGDKFTASSLVLANGTADPSGVAGYQALAGVFLEPSWPLTCLDLATGGVKVVDSSTGLPANEVGMRDTSTFYQSPNQEEVEDGTETDGLIAIWKTSGAVLGEGTLDLPENPITPGSLTISWTSGAATVAMTDDGAGGFAGSGTPGSSTVDYFTRELVINTTGDVPDAGTTIEALYTASGERVTFQVRRIRRFRELLDGIGNNLEPLRFAYETRRAEVGGYTPATRLLELDTATFGTATQLGDLNSEDVNINAGDDVLLLDASGNEVDRARVGLLLNATDILLTKPGFTQPVSVGDKLYIYLRTAPVPHEQSNEELLGLITETKVFSSTANPVADTGGRAGTVNVLSDNGVNLTSIGAQVGDIVIIDPAGELSGPTGQTSPPEDGVRPFGDTGVPARAEHVARPVSDLDDNRGYYRITALGPAADAAGLELNGESTFSGPDSSTNVVFGASGQEFAVYPTVSTGPGGPEGQMDLRVTQVADGSNSYQDGTFKSIEPFSYRIIRPSGIFSDETIDLVLMHRERILSWIEEITGPSDGTKQGDYFVFQRDDHITDLPSSATDGLGVPSNEALTTLSGEVDVAPFLNTSDCLSVLDRRFWILDTRLDTTRPPNITTGPPYSSFEEDALGEGLSPGSGRPVLPDRVDDVLDRTDRLRGLRFAWIRFRSDKINGTLPAIARFDAELPRLLQEQEDLLRLQEGLGDA